MIEGGDKIAYVPLSWPVTGFLCEIFCYPKRKRVFSPPKVGLKRTANVPEAASCHAGGPGPGSPTRTPVVRVL